MSLFHIITLGCPKNTVDAEKYAGCFILAGWESTNIPEEAGIILLNTCAFIEPAVSEALDVLGEIADWKASGKNRKIILAGCLPGRFEDDGSGGMEDIDLIIGPADTATLREYLGLTHEQEPRQVKLNMDPWRYLKISEGCSNNCNYCTIPQIRGPLNCWDPEDIMKDCDNLVSCGAAEVVVIAQDTCNWNYNGQDIVRLIDKLTYKYPDVWFRLQYLHPGHLTNSLLALIIERENLMPYLDLPIQHVSDNVLKRMGRGYGKAELEELFDRIENAPRRLAVRVTVIAGYPWETEEEVNELREFLLRWESIRTLTVFPYFNEEGTNEFKRGTGKLDEFTVSERVSIIGDIAGGIMNSWKYRLEGAEIDVLAHGGKYGHSIYDSPEVDWMCRFTENVSPGKIVRCTVEECFGYEMEVRPLALKTGSG